MRAGSWVSSKLGFGILSSLSQCLANRTILVIIKLFFAFKSRGQERLACLLSHFVFRPVLLEARTSGPDFMERRTKLRD